MAQIRKYHVFAEYHSNDDDTCYELLRIRLLTDPFPTICDGWDYKYLGTTSVSNDNFNEIQKIENQIERYFRALPTISHPFNNFKTY